MPYTVRTIPSSSIIFINIQTLALLIIFSYLPHTSQLDRISFSTFVSFCSYIDPLFALHPILFLLFPDTPYLCSLYILWSPSLFLWTFLSPLIGLSLLCHSLRISPEWSCGLDNCILSWWLHSHSWSQAQSHLCNEPHSYCPLYANAQRDNQAHPCRVSSWLHISHSKCS